MDREKLVHLRDLFAQAEHRLKVVETHTEFLIDDETKTGLLVPTINQLRYAGQHLFEYVVTEKNSDLDEIESHCKRALYDAYQVELMYYLKQFKEFQNEFEDLVISEVVREYIEWQELHENALATIRENVESQDRGNYYALLVPHIDNLSKIHPRLDKAREQLLKKRKQDSRRLKIAVASAAFAGITATFTVMHYWPEVHGWKSAHAHTAAAAPTHRTNR